LSRPEPVVGVLEWFEPGEHDRVERLVPRLRALGVRHLRTNISWHRCHDDGFDWYDWLLPLLARDFELLPCVSYTPPALGIEYRAVSPPRRTRDYADFLDVLVTRYGRYFDHVELWNEPNNLNDWDWRVDPSWAQFCEMIVDAAHWMRRRGKKVVLGGMCPTDPNWLRLIGQRNALVDVDVVGVHGFPGGWTTLWNGWEAEVASVRTVLDQLVLDAEVWITECGHSTWRNDEFAQLRAFVDVLDAPVERAYWYSAEDLDPARDACDGFHVDPRHYHFGLWHTDGEPKLLARGLADGGRPFLRMLSGLDEAKPVRRGRRGHVLITGGAGFIGTNLADRIASEGRRVVLFDSLSRAGVEENVLWLKAKHGERVHAHIADLRDAVALRESLEDADAVFHLGAQVAVTTSLERPLHDFAVNLQSTALLLEELRRRPVPLLFTSTNKVYGSLPEIELEQSDERWLPADPELRDRGISESRRLDFCTPYGCSKGGADQYVLDYAHTFGVEAVVFRMSCIYGPHQHGNEDQGWVAHFLIRALEGDPITIYGDGSQVRDILYATDLVGAMLLAHESIERIAGTAFNIGGGADNAISLLDLLALIEELQGTRPDVEWADERPGDQRWYASDTSRFRASTGWQPDVSAQEGIERLHAWLAARRRTAAAVA
jgi:CDP-paratose 2-epimerase